MSRDELIREIAHTIRTKPGFARTANAFTQDERRQAERVLEAIEKYLGYKLDENSRR